MSESLSQPIRLKCGFIQEQNSTGKFCIDSRILATVVWLRLEIFLYVDKNIYTVTWHTVCNISYLILTYCLLNCCAVLKLSHWQLRFVLEKYYKTVIICIILCGDTSGTEITYFTFKFKKNNVNCLCVWGGGGETETER